MQPRLLTVLRCPVTLEPLDLEIIEQTEVFRDTTRASGALVPSAEDREPEVIAGWLTAAKSGYRYPIVDGVPRLLVDTRLARPTDPTGSPNAPDQSLSSEYRQTVEHFRTQWENYAEEEKIFGRDVEASWRYFRETLCPPDVSDDWFRGRSILDAGCGHGKYVDALSRRGIEVFALDITPEVGRVYRKFHRRSNVHVVQANILHPPIAHGTMDYVFSNGVIHHTPNTRGAFHALGRLVRNGGYLAVWVYPFRSPAFDTVSQFLRSFTTRMPRAVLRPLCYLPVPLLSIPGWEAYSKTSLRNASWRECAQVVYDFFGPKYQTHHTPAELSQWYLEDGFEIPWIGPDPLSAAARKAA